jgi:hypothetical protein
LAIEMQREKAKLERLRYLKEALYSDPSLLIIDHLQRHPEDIGRGDLDFNKFYKLANSLRESERWWSPLMIAWSELAAQTQSQEAASEAMRALLDAIRRLDAKLATRHKLPTI